ncbi:MAG TPA: tRNA (adenosine(37)-N6)-dimethylallyltransferase MiaA [Gammaproteobacteria bacterium]|nr:tRNA (adenosine(37)-N6)-dimethylallyltransferase MiaA [Gammaproteobacteria bacterium]
MAQANHKSYKVICIMGPTASGKTNLAIELFCRVASMLISVDSAQVYRGLNIGAGKPSPKILDKVPHALINVVEPSQVYNAHQFCEDAKEIIKRANQEGQIPILVGGTMLYYRALLQGLSELPGANLLIREQLVQDLCVHGLSFLYEKLQFVDPVISQRIKPNDSQRIQRALEVFYSSGKPLSVWQSEHKLSKTELNALCIGLLPEDHERPRLHQQITTRFLKMMDQGLVEEVKNLLEDPKNSSELPAFKSVGYRQVVDYLIGTYDFQEMQEKAIIATRQLAKRQLTWLRSWPNLLRFNCFDSQLLKKVYKTICKF